jgi:hypothetical protein
MKDSKTYLIEVNYTNGEKEQIELTTDRLKWSMDEYQRNRKTFNWKVISEK